MASFSPRLMALTDDARSEIQKRGHFLLTLVQSLARRGLSMCARDTCLGGRMVRGRFPWEPRSSRLPGKVTIVTGGDHDGSVSSGA